MTEAKTRTPKTPKQRAEEALAVCDRKIGRVQAKVARLQEDARQLEADELQPLQLEREYLAASPYLQAPQLGVGAVLADHQVDEQP